MGQNGKNSIFERLITLYFDCDKLTEAKCQIFMRQILRGLDHLHNLNIVHLGTNTIEIYTCTVRNWGWVEPPPPLVFH